MELYIVRYLQALPKLKAMGMHAFVVNKMKAQALTVNTQKRPAPGELKSAMSAR